MGAFLYMGIDCLFRKKHPEEPKRLSTQDKIDFVRRVVNSKKLKLKVEDSKVGQSVENIIIFGNKKMDVSFEWCELRAGDTKKMYCSVKNKKDEVLTEFYMDEEDATPLLDGAMYTVVAHHRKKAKEEVDALKQNIINREHGDLGKIQKISKEI